MINVNKSYLPAMQEYADQLKTIWESNWLTNDGRLLIELELALKDYLGVNHVEIVANGTLALQIAIEALHITGEIITTPFSYVATSSSILWQNCRPVFVDIDRESLGMNPDLIEKAISKDTSAIMATHIYGIPCDIDGIQEVADKNNLKVIYDGAQAFGTTYKGRSIFDFGDITTASFHATKIFHTVEGGALVTKKDELAERVQYLKAFGHIHDRYFDIGINAKCSEFHAAMGLCVLPQVASFINNRKRICELYKEKLANLQLKYPKIPSDTGYNHAYFPIILPSEQALLHVKGKLHNKWINTRRYFYPSLNTLHFINGDSCPISEDISSRVLCLPLYNDLRDEDIEIISDTVSKALNKYTKIKDFQD